MILHAIRRHFLHAKKEPLLFMWPWTQLSASPRTVLFRWISFVDHAVPRAPRQWTTARPRKGMTRQWKPARRGLRGFTGSAAV